MSRSHDAVPWFDQPEGSASVGPLNVYQHVQATASAPLNVEGWKRAWGLAAPVVVAANRFVEAEKDGTPGLIEDAHTQLLAALADYRFGIENSQEAPK